MMALGCVFLSVWVSFLQINTLSYTETHNEHIAKLHLKTSYCFKVNFEIGEVSGVGKDEMCGLNETWPPQGTF